MTPTDERRPARNAAASTTLTADVTTGLRRRLNPETGQPYWDPPVTDAELAILVADGLAVDRAVDSFRRRPA